MVCVLDCCFSVAWLGVGLPVLFGVCCVVVLWVTGVTGLLAWWCSCL